MTCGYFGLWSWEKDHCAQNKLVILIMYKFFKGSSQVAHDVIFEILNMYSLKVAVKWLTDSIKCFCKTSKYGRNPFKLIHQLVV